MIAAATMATILIEAAASLRVEAADAWHLSSNFSHAAPFGVVLTLALVAVGEATRAPFTEYLLHQSLGVTFGPFRAVAASAILLLLWASTIAIVSFSDRAFGSAFATT